ncbi:hypothetical protein RV00_GL001201 [Enterococcus devriesei]|uniref:Uncharacterized protein n=1 Tax=Enterococcus devriesei TaxID=319970 RepID=A0A1L8SXN5_9ENTE|nr:hypothetical protein RV00_GL001201 [Enterococcus devriesei]
MNKYYIDNKVESQHLEEQSAKASRYLVSFQLFLPFKTKQNPSEP